MNVFPRCCESTLMPTLMAPRQPPLEPIDQTSWEYWLIRGASYGRAEAGFSVINDARN